MSQNYNEFVLIVEEFNNHKSIWVRLRSKHVTIESKGPMHSFEAEQYIDELIKKYRLRDDVSIVNKIFDQDGKFTRTLKETVKGYLQLGNKNR